MYTPKHFDETRTEVMHDLMRSHPLATIVTLTANGMVANHIPLYVHLPEGGSLLGVLQGHVARANPLWRETLPDSEVLAIFQGPEAYISPSWYATKAETGKVVPTWNYAVVHAHAHLQVRDDADWLRAQLERLTAAQEASFPESWQVSDAPHEYTEKLIGTIVGIELVITRLSGKWKMSQNQPAANQAGVVWGLQSLQNAPAATVANLVASAGASH